MGSIERVLIVGVGNLLLGDEGLGVHVAHALLAADPPLPLGVEVVDAGTSLLDVVKELGKCDRAILVDAIRAGGEPGSIYRLDLRGAPGLSSGVGLRPCVSLHELEVDDALAAARMLGMLPRRLELIGAEPETLEPGLVLSPAMARAARAIVGTLGDLVRVPPERNG